MKEFKITEFCPEHIYEAKEGVAYGTVEVRTYFSTTVNMERKVSVLLPAGYDKNVKYPVLYLQHGIFGDESTLLYHENVNMIELIGNMMAEGLMKEAVVVFPSMYVTSDPEMKPAFHADAVEPYDNFIFDLTADLMPFIRENYSVYDDRMHQAIGGFSLGGRQTLYVGLMRPDLFAYVGAVAPAPGIVPAKDWAMEHPGQMKPEEVTFSGKEYKPEVLLVCCGTKDGSVGKFPEEYHNLFDQNGVEHRWYEITDAEHNYVAIRSFLYNYLQVIF
ncbi:MAG: esterase family protein [Lachnospiraceae bacterium]|nr:esterase family protein [Lachnospiraceae bacterium]